MFMQTLCIVQQMNRTLPAMFRCAVKTTNQEVGLALRQSCHSCFLIVDVERHPRASASSAVQVAERRSKLGQLTKTRSHGLLATARRPGASRMTSCRHGGQRCALGMRWGLQPVLLRDQHQQIPQTSVWQGIKSPAAQTHSRWSIQLPSLHQSRRDPLCREPQGLRPGLLPTRSQLPLLRLVPDRSAPRLRLHWPPWLHLRLPDHHWRSLQCRSNRRLHQSLLRRQQQQSRRCPRLVLLAPLTPCRRHL